MYRLLSMLRLFITQLPLVLPLLTFLSLPVLSGCAALNNVLTSPVGSVATDLAVSVATSKVITMGTTLPIEVTIRAKLVKSIALQAETWVDSGKLPLSQVVQLVNQKILSLNLAPADMILATQLVNMLVMDIGNKISAGVLSPAEVTTVDTVLGYVVAATAAYGA